MKRIEQNLSGAGMHVGIVQSRFNGEICNELLNACHAELIQCGVMEDNITLVTVPGALESPLILSEMAASGRFDGLIAIGAIIRGETYHFEVVSNESARSISTIQAEQTIPIANAILTTENMEQAQARSNIKGTEAAQVVIEMINSLRVLHSITDTEIK